MLAFSIIFSHSSLTAGDQRGALQLSLPVFFRPQKEALETLQISLKQMRLFLFLLCFASSLPRFHSYSQGLNLI